MKSSTLQSLITAKTIFAESQPLIEAGNAHSCSAGLLMLQDAVELIVLALLGEHGVDETKNLEKKSFDELLGELKSTGTPLPKLGTIKALNKQRVITKHYGQLAEPVTVRNYFEAAKQMIDAALRHTIKKPLDEVLLTDLLPACEAKNLLVQAIELREKGAFLDCLIEIRKAFYVEYESDYAIHDWTDIDAGAEGLWKLLGHGGSKAPCYTRNKVWIAENVTNPVDYVQIDYERMRTDVVEWGVSTSVVDNIRRLTPSVFRAGKESAWHVKYDLTLPANEANLSNCNYCLDTIISILLKKKEHENARRWPRNTKPHTPYPAYVGNSVFSSARTDSKVVHVVQEGYLYTMQRLVSGFKEDEKYFYLWAYEVPDKENPSGKNHVWGYLLKVD